LKNINNDVHSFQHHEKTSAKKTCCFTEKNVQQQYSFYRSYKNQSPDFGNANLIFFLQFTDCFVALQELRKIKRVTWVGVWPNDGPSRS